MPGIFGVIAKKRQTTEKLKSQYERMGRLLNHFDTYRIESYEGDAFIVGRIGYPHRGYSSLRYDGTSHRGVVFDGFLYGWRGEDLGKNPATTEPVSLFPLEKAYNLASIPPKMNGSFNIFLFDRDTDRFYLSNSRLGYRNLFYYEDDEVFAFAPEVKAFLGLDSFKGQVNQEGAADFFNYSFVIGGRTLAKDVQRIYPATMITIENRKVTETRKYWECTFTDELEGDGNEWAKKLMDMTETVLERQIGNHDKFIVALSGGMDSRFLAHFTSKMPELDINYRTHGYEKSDDVVIARQVAQTLGIQNKHYLDTGDPESYGKLGAWTAWLVDGMVYLHCCALADIVQRYPEQPTEYEFLNSQFSGAMNYGMAYSNENHLKESIPFSQKMRQVHRICSSTYFDERYYRLFTPEFREILMTYKNSHLEDELKRHENAGKYFAAQLDRFSFETRALRLANNYDLNRYFYHTHFALIDDEMFSLYSQIPLKLTILRRLYTKMFCDFLPAMAKIPYEKTGVDLYSKPSPWRYRKRHAFTRMQYYIGRLSMGKININDKHNYVQRDQWYRKYPTNRLFFENILLDSRTLSRGYFEPNEIKTIMTKERHGSSIFNVISNLTTFELFNRYFIDGEEPPKAPFLK